MIATEADFVRARAAGDPQRGWPAAAERERLAKMIEEKAGPIYNFPNGNQGLADWLRTEGSK